MTDLQQEQTDPGVPVESFSLSYGSIVEGYLQQGPDGRALTPLTGGWDLVKNMQTLDRSRCAPAPTP